MYVSFNGRPEDICDAQLLISRNDLSGTVGVAAPSVMTLEHLPPPERRRIANALFGVGDATLDRARIVLLDTGTPAVGEAR